MPTGSGSRRARSGCACRFGVRCGPTTYSGHLAATAVPGVEEWRDGWYRQTLRLPHGAGVVAISRGRSAAGAGSSTSTPTVAIDEQLARDAHLGVVKAARALGLPSTPAALAAASAAWRPWRAYAVQHLWATGDHAVNRLPAG